MPIGKLEPFNLDSNQWPAYIRRVKQYVLLNEVSDDLKVSLLITVVGEATYALMCDLCAPEFPESKSFTELVRLVTEHLEPQRSEVAERHVFRLRRQRAGEPLTEYLQALKHLASTCNFGKCGSCSTLEENLRDQFVSGLANDAMRSRIFAEKKIEYKAARLAAYDFKVEFVRSAENGPADALSRLPLALVGRSEAAVEYLNLVADTFPISFKDVAREVERDVVLSKIKGYVLFGWPGTSSCEAEKPYFARKLELSEAQGCLIYRYRIVIPPMLQKRVLAEIHEGHLGVNKMKGLSRSYVYWPSLDQDIESTCRSCDACRAVRDAPPRAQLHPWEFPLHPWQRLHADFGDCGARYLIVVDAHSKWIEALPMKSTEARSTINAFRSIFARFGLPSELVTDNGPPFSSREFRDFCEKNCIRHITSALYRPQANGAAENAVKTIKKAIKRALYEGVDVNTALNNFLLKYRNCPHTTTGVSPAVALQGRRLRSRLDALRPDVGEVVRAAQDRQVRHGPSGMRDFNVGDDIYARNYATKGDKWVPGTVTKKTGPVSYQVEFGDGFQGRRHVDQIVSASKNRFWLTRTSTDSREGDKGTNVPEVLSPGCQNDPPGGVHDVKALPSVSSPEVVPETSTQQTPTPPDVSARALRAINRARRAAFKL